VVMVVMVMVVLSAVEAKEQTIKIKIQDSTN
jgi:hypothetical protein